MTDATHSLRHQADIVVVGGGPAGLSAATRLKHLGAGKVVVLEREPHAGGIPRHCGHPPFGMREFKRILTGPAYARALVKTAESAGVEIKTATTVVEMQPGGKLLVTDADGVREIVAKRVIYATGVRETPRSARMVGGQRPLGILNTGALQSMVYLKNLKPFERPVIVGTELVSFSAILTCRHMRIRPQAMLEESARVTARWPVRLLAGVLGVPIHFKTHIDQINGTAKVTSLQVHASDNNPATLACDGVLMTGCFKPEATLARCGHLQVDEHTGGPLVDNYGRCSDPAYFATGNILRPVETAGWSWREGKRIADFVAADLAGKLPPAENSVAINISGPVISYCMPQKFSPAAQPENPPGMPHLQLRFSRAAKGILMLKAGDEILWRKKISSRRERRILVPVKPLEAASGCTEITLSFTEN